MKRGFAFTLSLSLFLLSSLSGDILLDEAPLKRGKILLFRDHAYPNTFFYLSTEIRVASNPDGRPKVSYLKLRGQESALSFFLTYGLTPEKLTEIRKDLAEENQETLLKGPVSFSNGRFSIINRINGNSELWAEGKAPLFPNQEVVVTKRMKEPPSLEDLVAVFVMEFEGITKKINARLLVKWDEVYVQRDIKEKTNWTSVEIKESLHALRRSGAIQLEVTGDSGELAKVWSIAYEHLMHQMFDVHEININEQAALGVEWGIDHKNIIYSLKKERKTGSYSIDFNRRFKDKRQIILVSDIGDTIKEAINQ